MESKVGCDAFTVRRSVDIMEIGGDGAAADGRQILFLVGFISIEQARIASTPL